MNISEATFERKVAELNSPYHLSFATLHEFVSIICTVTLETGEARQAEVVPLLGYSEESEASILEYLEKTLPNLAGRDIEESRKLLLERIPAHPFSVSAPLTAIDLFEYALPETPDLQELDFVAPCSTDNQQKMLKLCETSSAGSTIKIKLSGDLNTDVSGLACLNPETLEGVILRLDANQAFDLETAKQFYEALSDFSIVKHVEYIEQPLPVAQWDENKELVDSFSIDTMLDEAVVDANDVKRAFELGVPYIKLKLFKQGGIRETIALARYANDLGLKVVFGNGVATWESNQVEIFLHQSYPALFWGASEANGFLKVRQ